MPTDFLMAVLNHRAAFPRLGVEWPLARLKKLCAVVAEQVSLSAVMMRYSTNPAHFSLNDESKQSLKDLMMFSSSFFCSHLILGLISARIVGSAVAVETSRVSC